MSYLHRFSSRQYGPDILLVYNEISSLLNVLTHDGVHLGELAGRLAAYQLVSQHVADLVKLGGLTALAGNDQRGSCFIDQDGIDLIDDGIIQQDIIERFRREGFDVGTNKAFESDTSRLMSFAVETSQTSDREIKSPKEDIRSAPRALA